jgi:hypothetical protein
VEIVFFSGWSSMCKLDLNLTLFDHFHREMYAQWNSDGSESFSQTRSSLCNPNYTTLSLGIQESHHHRKLVSLFWSRIGILLQIRVSVTSRGS